MQLPLFFDDEITFWISGLGVKSQPVRVAPGRVPNSISLVVLLPMVVGKIEFPPGFTEWERIKIVVDCSQIRGGQLRLEAGVKGASGEFEVKRIGYDLASYEFTVRVSIPGHPGMTKGPFRINSPWINSFVTRSSEIAAGEARVAR